MMGRRLKSGTTVTNDINSLPLSRTTQIPYRHHTSHTNSLPLSAPTHLSRAVQGFDQLHCVDFLSAHRHSHYATTHATAATTVTVAMTIATPSVSTLATTSNSAPHSASTPTSCPYHRGGNITRPTRGGIPHHRARPPQRQGVRPPTRVVALLGGQVGEAGAETVELEVSEAHLSLALGEEVFDCAGRLGWGR